MKSIKLKDLEKLIIEKYSEDEKFKKFLKENRELEVEVVVENIKLKELEDMEEFTEETVIAVSYTHLTLPTNSRV